MDIEKKRQELIKDNIKSLQESIESRGLGDTVEKVFEKTGIKYVAKKVLGDDCGCNKRKEKLNKLVPYNKGQVNEKKSKND